MCCARRASKASRSPAPATATRWSGSTAPRSPQGPSKSDAVEVPEVADDVFARVRAICEALPEAEVDSDRWAHKFTVSRRVFAYLFAIDNPQGDQVTMLVGRADPQERAALLGAGHPYFAPNSGTDRVGIVLDDATDWTEIAELVTDSYELNAPKRLRG